MIAKIDAYLAQRFADELGDQPAYVYAPETVVSIGRIIGGPAREKGEIRLPAVEITRFLPRIDVERALPGHEEFTPSEETQTIRLPDIAGGREVTGPAFWTIRPFATPYILDYQIDLHAAYTTHMDRLVLLLAEVMPVSHSFRIDGIDLEVLPKGDPVNLDEIEKPNLRIMQRYEILNVWLDRRHARTVPSISEVDFGMTA